jgi:mono/diheme cytochrome c family protein
MLILSCDYSTEPYKEGKRIYENQCAPCHGMNGEGFGSLYPNLYDTSFINGNRFFLSCWIRRGIGPDSLNARKERYSDLAMPALPNLSSIDLCNVLNYLNGQFWKMESFSINEIESQLKSCEHIKNDMQ